MNTRNGSALRVTLTALVVVGLAVDAFVHFDLAGAFANNKTSTLSEADLFRAEAVGAVVAAVLVLLRPRRYTAAIAFVVAAGGVLAVVVYRYVNVGAFGPIPNMYDPYWAPAEKNLSLIGEAVAALAALALFALLQAHARLTQESPAARRTTAQMSPG
jgi:hypothetical protein